VSEAHAISGELFSMEEDASQEEIVKAHQIFLDTNQKGYLLYAWLFWEIAKQLQYADKPHDHIADDILYDTENELQKLMQTHGKEAFRTINRIMFEGLMGSLLGLKTTKSQKK
jgi:hypothetical protein